MWIGWSVPRELAVEHAALLDEQLADAIVALGQVFALLGADAVDARGGAEARDGSRGRRFSGRRARHRRTARRRRRARSGPHSPCARSRARPGTRGGGRGRSGAGTDPRHARAPRARPGRKAAAAAGLSPASFEGFARGDRAGRARAGAKGPVFGQGRRRARARWQRGRTRDAGVARRAPRSRQPRPCGRRTGPAAVVEFSPKTHSGSVVTPRRPS